MNIACRKCSITKPADDFYPSYRSGERANQWCKVCAAEYARSWQAKNRGRYLVSRRRRYAALVDQIQEAYGRKCTCCGEAEKGFLTIDHVNGDGAAHRREVNGSNYNGSMVYRQIVAQGFPDTFQLLCFNCNLGRAKNGGVCPHRVGVKLI